MDAATLAAVDAAFDGDFKPLFEIYGTDLNRLNNIWPELDQTDKERGSKWSDKEIDFDMFCVAAQHMDFPTLVDQLARNEWMETSESHINFFRDELIPLLHEKGAEKDKGGVLNTFRMIVSAVKEDKPPCQQATALVVATLGGLILGDKVFIHNQLILNIPDLAEDNDMDHSVLVAAWAELVDTHTT